MSDKNLPLRRPPSLIKTGMMNWIIFGEMFKRMILPTPQEQNLSSSRIRTKTSIKQKMFHKTNRLKISRQTKLKHKQANKTI